MSDSIIKINEEEEIRRKLHNLFHKYNDLPAYLSKVRQCRRIYDESFKYERGYFSKELDKRMKNVAFQKIMETGSNNLIKSRAYYDAIMEYDAIEEAFRNWTIDGCPLASNSVLEKIKTRISSVLDDVLECLLDIIEDIEVFEIFIECDKIENANSKIVEFRDYLENVFVWNNEELELSETTLEEIKEKMAELSGINKSFLL